MKLKISERLMLLTEPTVPGFEFVSLYYEQTQTCLTHLHIFYYFHAEITHSQPMSLKSSCSRFLNMKLLSPATATGSFTANRVNSFGNRTQGGYKPNFLLLIVLRCILHFQLELCYYRILNTGKQKSV